MCQVCDWPSSIVCACDITEPDVECCLDSDCPSQPGGCPDSYCLGFKALINIQHSIHPKLKKIS